MKAIILAAGMGNRLLPLTADRPKGMIEVNQTPILKNTLDALAGYKDELTEIIMVVGYRQESIRDYFGKQYRGMDITYVVNSIYDATNNIYSLALSTQCYQGKEDILLFESDVYFEPAVLDRLMQERRGRQSIAVVDAYKPWMDGTVVTLKDGYIGELVSSKHIDRTDVYKTVNIYYFSGDFFNDVFMPMLKVYMQTHSTNHYYEIVLKAIVHLDYFKIRGLCIDGLKWYEIDDVQDLSRAAFLFKDHQGQLCDIRQSWGGYWNFDIVDYNFICNAFFPGDTFCKSLSQNLHALLTAYPSARGIINRKAAAAFDEDPACLLVCNGASEAIKFLMQCFLRPVVVTPNFGEYSNHPCVVKWPLRERDDFQLDLERLHRAVLGNDCDAVVITNPNNPTARKTSRTEIEAFLDVLPEDVTLVLDTSFEDFTLGSVAPDPHRHENLVVVKSLGKAVGLPGIRLGYVRTANRMLLDRLDQMMPIWNVNSFAEFFFENYTKFKKDIQHSIAQLNAEKEVLIQGLESIRLNGRPMFKVIGRDANFLFCRLDQQVDADSLAEHLYKAGRIVIKDCTDKVQPAQHGYVRLNVLPSDSNQLLLDCCQEYCRQAALCA